ncbi:hypothetical protein [Actinomadura luzonensis]|nr:hypothetical protein [Actinomadura luzonensis]
MASGCERRWTRRAWTAGLALVVVLVVVLVMAAATPRYSPCGATW